MEKAYSHSILLQFLWFTSDISLLLCVCAQDRALPTMKWFKRLCRVSLETIKFQWESTLGHHNIFALALSWRLLADAWIWILSQVSSGIQHSITSNQPQKFLSPWVRITVSLSRASPEEQPVQCHPRGHGCTGMSP